MLQDNKNKDKISGKDIFALIIAQYSVMLPWVLIGGAIFGFLVWLIVDVMMR